jgi:hypothetical protein
MTKIAILGSAPSSISLAPVHDQEWDIWACSPPNYNLARVDAWFELHNLDRKFIPINVPYQHALIAHPRVYITKPDERLPDGILFPWEHLVSQYGPYFFSSSIAWMMAFAIAHKPDKIGLWGVDMAASSEYEYQRPGVHFFMQEAKRNGIEVYTPQTSDIAMPHPLYAVKEHWPMWAKFHTRRKELQKRLDAATQGLSDAQRDADMFKGALDDMQYTENTWLQPNWIKEAPNEPLDPQPADADEDGSQPSDGDSSGS